MVITFHIIKQRANIISLAQLRIWWEDGEAKAAVFTEQKRILSGSSVRLYHRVTSEMGLCASTFHTS